MILETLNLVNFCQHRNLTLNFSPGLNAIVGPIGSGKSNILKAIRFLFTNKSGNAGKKEDDITYSLETGVASSVSTVSSHRGVGFELFRSLNASRRFLKWADEELKLTAERDIAESLKARLGVDSSVFDEFIVVNQGKLSTIIDLAPADRMVALQGLVGLDKFAQLYTWLGNYATTNVPTVVTAESEEGILASISSLENQLAEAEKQQFSVTEEEQEKFQKAQEFIAKHSELDFLKAQKIGIATRLSEVVNYQHQQSAVLANQQAAIAKAKVDIENERNLEKERAAIGSKTAIFSHWRNLQNRLVYCQQATKEMEIPSWVFPRDALQPTPQMVQAEQQLNVLLHLKKLLTGAANKICPTCFQPLKDELFVSLDAIPQWQQFLDSERNRLNQSISFWSGYSSWQSAAQAAQLEIPQIMKSLSELPADVESYGSLAAIPPSPVALPVMEANLKKLEEQATSLHSSLIAAETEANTLQGRQSELESKLMAFDPSYSFPSVEEAVKFSTTHKDKLQAQAEAKGALVILKQQLDATREKLNAFKVEAAKAQKFRDFRSDILAARDIFHRNNLPSHLSKEALSSLAYQMNKVLDSFGATYRLCESKDGAFSVRFFDDSYKGIQPDTRLSGGERSQFGLAMRIASHSLWAQDLGFMALDEPTYGFSHDDLRCVEVAINHLKKLSTEQGLQIIVITHEKSLLPLFDKVISLE